MRKLMCIIAAMFCLSVSAQVKKPAAHVETPVQTEKVDSSKIPLISLEMLNIYLTSIVDKQGVSHMDYLKIQAAFQAVVNEAMKLKQSVTEGTATSKK